MRPVAADCAHKVGTKQKQTSNPIRPIDESLENRRAGSTDEGIGLKREGRSTIPDDHVEKIAGGWKEPLIRLSHNPMTITFLLNVQPRLSHFTKMRG